MIPKVMWTFWDTEELPEFIRKCIETWRHFNSDYEIIVMNLNNYKKYTNIDITKLRHYSENKPQLTSDYIRCCVLKEHGGVWIDASTLCIKPLKFKEDTEFFVYYLDNNSILSCSKYPIIENWFIATSKNNSFMNEWYREFVEVTENYSTISMYILSLNTTILKNYFSGYFAMHIAALKTFKKLDQENKLPKMTLKHAWVDGPLLDNINYENYEKELCIHIDFNMLNTPIVKINGDHRKKIMSDKFYKDCIIKKIDNLLSDKNAKYLITNEYVNNLGYNNLNGYFQEQSKQKFVLIILSICILLIIIIVIIISRLLIK